LRIQPLIILATLVATPVFPQNNDLSERNMSSLVNGCVEAIDRGEDASAYGSEVYSREGFRLGAESSAKGVRCLETVFGGKFEYKNNRFINPVEVEAARASAEETQRLKSMKQKMYLDAVIDACISEYKTDRFRALTTPMCGDVFKELGLPD